MRNRKLSVLFYSNSPWASSGYSKQTRYILAGIVKNRHKVGLSPNYGMGTGKFVMDGYEVLAQGGGLSENETIDHYLNGKYEVLISLYDVWVLQALAAGVRKNRVIWCPYTPLDIPPGIGGLDQNWRDILSAATYIIPFAKFGANLLRASGFENVWKNGIYHGLDTDIYHPLYEDVPKEKLRKSLGFNKESFILANFKMNKGDRVKYPEQLEAIRIFLDANPDVANEVGVYLHTAANFPGGVDLKRIIKTLGLESKVRFPNPYNYFVGFTEEEMAQAYNASDLILNNSSSGGFELPIIESMACGVPVLATNVEVMKELLESIAPELLVTPKTDYWTPIATKQYQPDPYAIAERIEYVLNADPEHYRKVLPEYARKTFDWDVIIPQWIEFLEFLPGYIDEQCLRIPVRTSAYLRKLNKALVMYE